MLTDLTINNVVLIKALTLECASGLTALTGETGAGKSILLDALGLATGGRSESRLVRKGEDKASVTATFDLPDKHLSNTLLSDQDIVVEDNLILKRVIGADGKSKAFINNQPVSISFLKEIGETLLEVHGQFETHGLLDPKTHRSILDNFAGLERDLSKLNKQWDEWQETVTKRKLAEKEVEDNETEKEYLATSIEDLSKLAPEKGEEKDLSEKRTRLQNTEAILSAFNQMQIDIAHDKGAEDKINTACRALERVAEKAGSDVEQAVEKMDTALNMLRDAVSIVDTLASDMGNEEYSLEEVDDRLYALKSQARKHGCFPDDLPEKLEELRQKLDNIINQDTYLGDLYNKERAAKAAYILTAENVSEKRTKAAVKFVKAVNAELPPLKLEKAKIFINVETMTEDKWSSNGMDAVNFTISTNPGQDPGPLNKIASGGELSRFMLAFKVVMAGTGIAPVMIFDEIDAGVGGSTADAIGERLSRLAHSKQVLVVTHSPQVAARAQNHWIISKGPAEDGSIKTVVTPLEEEGKRREEIARMLAGAEVTSEARAAADRLLQSALKEQEAA